MTFPKYLDNICNQLSLNLGAWPITEMQTINTSTDISDPQGDSNKFFICEQCNYSCKKASVLKLHKRTHSGEKPFNCTLCKFSCALVNTLKTHKRKHTGKNLTIAHNATTHVHGLVNFRHTCSPIQRENHSTAHNVTSLAKEVLISRHTSGLIQEKNLSVAHTANILVLMLAL